MNKLAALRPRRVVALCASILLTFILAAAAQAEQRPVMTSHVPDAVSSGVAPFVGRVPGSQRMSLAISLPLRNEAQLDELLQQIYDPQSSSYHKYLSVGGFVTKFGPTQSDYLAVVQFARSNGLNIIDVPVNRMVLDVEGPAANIESAFHITLGV